MAPFLSPSEKTRPAFWTSRPDDRGNRLLPPSSTISARRLYELSCDSYAHRWLVIETAEYHRLSSRHFGLLSRKASALAQPSWRRISSTRRVQCCLVLPLVSPSALQVVHPATDRKSVV